MSFCECFVVNDLRSVVGTMCTCFYHGRSTGAGAS